MSVGLYAFGVGVGGSWANALRGSSIHTARRRIIFIMFV
jgi:hypothetical protein